MGDEAYSHLKKSDRKPEEIQKAFIGSSFLPFQAPDEMGGDEKETDGFTPQEKAIMEELCSAMLELLTKPYEYHMIDFLCDAEKLFRYDRAGTLPGGTTKSC